MSTRAVYGFKDSRNTHWVYVHHDGYPTGAADKFAKTLAGKFVWPLPRFEADEFAAGFVTANKRDCGSVRLTTGPEAHGDTEYAYVIEDADGKLYITAFNSGEPSKETLFYSGLLSKFIETAEQLESALQE